MLKVHIWKPLPCTALLARLPVCTAQVFWSMTGATWNNSRVSEFSSIFSSSPGFPPRHVLTDTQIPVVREERFRVLTAVVHIQSESCSAATEEERN
ncbi:hypothetical protein NQZ68_017659 [Dissostichus eleginoides]|nr:hypothetical protein NQZ68_017659 [Dissostichus eleginoides]